MDAAKIMWVMYDIRKLTSKNWRCALWISVNVLQVPENGRESENDRCHHHFCTGSEVTPFAVVTDDATGQKFRWQTMR